MRYLSDADVHGLLPTPLEAVDLVADALVALAAGRAEVPPKPAVHTVPGSFANAMPASLPARGLLGCKWISIFPGNARLGLPTATGLMVVNDGRTGAPVCVMEAGELTAARTAAVSGACVRALDTGSGHTAILGAGVQARSHLRVLEALGSRQVVVYARRAEAREALAEWAAAETPGLRLRVTGAREEAVWGAGVVITALPIGLEGEHLDPEWVSEDALLLPLDYATSVGPELARSALLAADDVRQFEAVRAARRLGDYPMPGRWTGELLVDATETFARGGRREPEALGRPAAARQGRVVCQNLGNGLSDLVVAAAVAAAADAQDAGQRLVGGGT